MTVVYFAFHISINDVHPQDLFQSFTFRLQLRIYVGALNSMQTYINMYCLSIYANFLHLKKSLLILASQAFHSYYLCPCINTSREHTLPLYILCFNLSSQEISLSLCACLNIQV